MQLKISWESSYLPLLLAVLRSRLRQVSSHFLTPFGLTPQQFQAMAILEQFPGICATQLAEALSMDKPTATRILQTLQKRHWVAIHPHPSHRKKRCLSLTPEGSTLIAQLEDFRTAFRNGLEEGLEPDERRQLRQLLQRLAHNLDRLEEQLSPTK